MARDKQTNGEAEIASDKSLAIDGRADGYERERTAMRNAGRGLYLKIVAMILLFVSLLLFLFVCVYFPKAVFTDDFFWYFLGTVLSLMMLDLVGRLHCWRWPIDSSARLAVISSTTFQIAAVIVLVVGGLLWRNEPSGREMVFSVLLLLVVGVQAASAYFFMGYTRRVCTLLRRNDLAWQPSLVLAAYGMSGLIGVGLAILFLILAFAICIMSALRIWVGYIPQVRFAVSSMVLLLVSLPFHIYGNFLFRLARAIAKGSDELDVVESQIIEI